MYSKTAPHRPKLRQERHGLEYRNHLIPSPLHIKHAAPDGAWALSGGLGCYKHATPTELLHPGRIPPKTAKNRTICFKVSRHSSLSHIGTDLGGNRRHEDFVWRRESAYSEHQQCVDGVSADQGRCLAAFATSGRKGTGAALAPVRQVVSGSTQPEQFLRTARRCRGLGIPQGWGGTLNASRKGVFGKKRQEGRVW